MPKIADVQTARVLLQNFHGWFGPPAIRFGNATGALIDGRKRWTAFHQLCMPGSPPELVAPNKREAGRLLLLAQHVRRAHDLLGETIPYDLNTAVLLRVPPEVGASLVAHVRRELTRKPRRAPRRRQEVIDRLRALYLECTQHGHQLTPADLREVLGDWA